MTLRMLAMSRSLHIEPKRPMFTARRVALSKRNYTASRGGLESVTDGYRTLNS